MAGYKVARECRSSAVLFYPDTSFGRKFDHFLVVEVSEEYKNQKVSNPPLYFSIRCPSERVSYREANFLPQGIWRLKRRGSLSLFLSTCPLLLELLQPDC